MLKKMMLLKYLLPFIFMISFTVQSADELKNVRLRTISSDQWQTLADIARNDLVLIIAYGSECPILRKHTPELNNIIEKYGTNKIHVVVVNTVKNLSDERLAEEKTDYAVKAPVYQAENLAFMQKLGLTTLSEVALISVSKSEVLYRGAINNQFTLDLSREKPTENYLRDAIESAMKNKKIKTKTTKAFGCEISY